MSSRSTSEFFDSYADEFNAIYGNKNTFMNILVNKLLRKSMRLRFEKTIEGCRSIEGKTVIDIGCGPGHYGITLAKRGAKFVYGVDFAQGMINLAKENARKEKVEDRCDFALSNFIESSVNDKFDYSIVMGLMDYIVRPEELLAKVLYHTNLKAFFSFPADDGILAWQRKLRYKNKCELYLYNEKKLGKIFKNVKCKKFEIEKISRDYFITVFLS